MGDRRRPGFRLLPLLLCAYLSAQSWPTFHSAYQDGLEAQARGDHALAVKAFGRAAAMEPRPGERVPTYGLNFLPYYHPYLRMAESALALGDAITAEAALAESARQGIEPGRQREALLGRLQALKQAPPKPPAKSIPKPEVPAVEAPRPAPVRASAPKEAVPPRAAPPREAVAAPPGPLLVEETRRAAERPHREEHAAPAVQAAAPMPLPASAPPSGQQVPQPPAPLTSWRVPALAGGAALLLAGGWAALRRKRAEAPPGPDDGDPNLGRSFGPFTALSVLGRGGNATAYRGRCRETGREVALKVPHPHLARDPDFLARFRREASLGTLLDHPRIVGILDPGPAEGQPWLAMPFVPGTTLEARLRQGPLPLAEALRVAEEVAEAMAYAHAQGVVHRDLKPANIMLAQAGAVVMDLGIARIQGSGKQTSVFVGTPTYSAPESVAHPSVGPAADRYALGLVLFEMLAGHPPFQGDNPFQVFEAHRFDPLPDLEALRPGIPSALADLVARLCAKEPGARPDDAEVLEALRTLRGAPGYP